MIAIDLVASSLAGIAKSTLLGSQLVSTTPKVEMPRRLASASAICSCPISMMKRAAGTRPSWAIPPSTFSILSLSRLRVRRSFLVMLSKEPSVSIFSMLCIFFTLLRTVLKLVSIPPSHLSVTKGMFTFFALSFTISFACFLVPTKRIFFPLRAIAFMAAAVSCRHSTVLFRSMM